MPSSHHTVSRDLRNDAGGSDAQGFCVPTDDRGLWLVEHRNRKTVYQKMVRLHRQSCDRSLHRQKGRPEDIKPIDLCGFGDADAVTDEFSRGGQRCKELLTHCFGELF